MSVYCGKNLRIEIFGSSHASELGVCISGLPKGLAVNEAALQSFLRRRSPGNDPLCSKRREDDVPIFTQGITDGVTDGTVRAVIKNRDVKRQDYVNLTAAPRPGHADLAAWQKYGLDYDMSGGGPFSGRMTAALCIAGGIVIQELDRRGITLCTEVVSPLSGHDLRKDAEVAARLGDSIGGIVKCTVFGLPSGIGGELFDGIDGHISELIFAIPGVKGIEFGAGFASAALLGSENNDQYSVKDGKVEILSNNAGGVLGGITNGMPLRFSVAFKPTPSIAKAQKSVDLKTLQNVDLHISGRHDACFALRTPPVVESAAAIALYDIMLTDCATQELSELRRKIELADAQIIERLKERLELCSDIAVYKREHGLPVLDAERERSVLDGVPPEFHDLYRQIFEISKARQKEIIGHD